MKQKYTFSIIASILAVIAFFAFVKRDNEVHIKQPKLAPGEWMAHQRMFPHDEIKPEAYKEEVGE